MSVNLLSFPTVLIPHAFHPSWFDLVNNIWSSVKIMKFHDDVDEVDDDKVVSGTVRGFSYLVAAGAAPRAPHSAVRPHRQLYGESAGQRKHLDPRQLPAEAGLRDFLAAHIQGRKTAIFLPFNTRKCQHKISVRKLNALPLAIFAIRRS